MMTGAATASLRSALHYRFSDSPQCDSAHFRESQLGWKQSLPPQKRMNVSTPTTVFGWQAGKDVHTLNVDHPDLAVSVFKFGPNQQIKLLFCV